MKKKSIMLTVIFMTTVSFAQFSIANNNGERIRITGKTTSKIKTDKGTKAVYLTEDFEGGVLPTGWTESNSADTTGFLFGTNLGSAFCPIPDHTGYAAANDDLCNCDMSNVLLATPAIDLSDAPSPLLKFQVYHATQYGGTFTVRVSTNGGTDWTDVADIPGNTEWEEMIVPLAAYGSTSDVMIGFHYSDDGGWSAGVAIDDISVEDGATTPDLIVEGGVDEIYTILPLDQVLPVTSFANVTNFGVELTVATNVDFGITSESYSDATAITVPLGTSETDTVIAGSSFTPVAIGSYEFTYEAVVVDDANPGDNSDTYTYIVTDSILSYSSGINFGLVGLEDGAMFGNKFVFNNNDDLTGVSFHIVSGASPYDCTVKAFEFTEDSLGLLIAETPTISITNQDSIYTVNFSVAVSVIAGQEVLIVVDNLASEAIMNLGTDERYIENIPWVSIDGISFVEVGLIGSPNLFELDAVLGSVFSISDDVAIISIHNTNATAGNIDITGTVRNMGNQGHLTSFDIVYSIDGGVASSVYNVTGVSIAPGIDYDFTHNVQWNATADVHTIEVSLSNPNGNTDENPANNVMSKEIMIVNEVFPKNVVYEEGTGTWCGWCVYGIVGLNTMAHNHTDGTWIGIGVHFGDPMEDTTYGTTINGFIPGYPSGIMDRYVAQIEPDVNSLEPAYQEQLLEIPIAKVDINNGNYNSTTREMVIDIESTFALDIASADYNAAIIVVENGVTGTGSEWDQVNYYNGGDQGPMTDWDGFDYTTAGNPVPAADMTYNHVGRVLLGGWSGDAGSIPSSVVYNTAYVYEYTHTLPADQDFTNIYLVGIVIDNATGHIINGIEVKAEDVLAGINQIANSNYCIYPNPTTGLIRIDNVEGAQIVIYNMLGAVVYSEANTSATTTIDLSSLNAENYIVKIINNDEIAIQKIVLIK